MYNNNSVANAGGYPNTSNYNASYTNPALNNYMNMIDHQQWYNNMNYNSIVEQSTSNSREQRNKAEKMRRDKLNFYISELASLVPLVSKSPKRMDKTSILRLTATYLRIYQTLTNGTSERMSLPPEIDQFILENLVCEQLGGFLMILSGSGKVIFVSPTIETVLGHLQTDLMGQSIFNVIAPEDQTRFKMYLRTDLVTNSDWRKYFNLRIRRAGPRSETPVYEAVEVMGVKQVTRGNLSHAESHSRDLQAINSDMWVFFMRLNKPEPITDRLIEASKDEYVTRHLIDGRIINCDQRISFIAGYMIEEVSGLTAFKFMHRDDVRWVMIALRQMYDKGEARGSSCYRLLSRTGQFIYLRTFGFLEIDNTGTVKSFICVNKLVSEKEGVELITEMKQRYSALIKSTTPKLQLTNEEINNPLSGSVEDPIELEAAITHLISDLPSPESEASDHTAIYSSENRDCPSTSSAGSLSPCDHKNVPKRPPSTDKSAAPYKRLKIEAPATIASPTRYCPKRPIHYNNENR